MICRDDNSFSRRFQMYSKFHCSIHRITDLSACTSVVKQDTLQVMSYVSTLHARRKHCNACTHLIQLRTLCVSASDSTLGGTMGGNLGRPSGRTLGRTLGGTREKWETIWEATYQKCAQCVLRPAKNPPEALKRRVKLRQNVGKRHFLRLLLLKQFCFC